MIEHVPKKFFPLRVRAHLVALSDFAKAAHKLVDTPAGTGHDRRKAIEAYRRAAIDAIRNPAGAQDHILKAFGKTAGECRIPELEIHAFLDAIALDSYKKSYRDMRELEEYLRGTAAALAYMTIHISGHSGEKETARTYARSLAEALAMTHFLAATKLNARRDRIYIPLSVLHKHGTNEEEFKRGKMTPQLRKSIYEMTVWARNKYHDGVSGIRQLPKDVALPTLLAARYGVRILEKIEQEQYDIFSKPPHISSFEERTLRTKMRIRYSFLKHNELRVCGLTHS